MTFIDRDGVSLVDVCRLWSVTVLFLVLAACGRQQATDGSETAPAVAPIPSTPQSNAKHYTQADFDAACFPFPTQQILLQYEQLEHLVGQDAVDAEYRQLATRFPSPPGECEIKKEAEQQTPERQRPRPGQWIENAPANDMTHYGDALPGGKN